MNNVLNVIILHIESIILISVMSTWVILSVGCGGLSMEGAVDYRKAEIYNEKSQQDLQYTGGCSGAVQSAACGSIQDTSKPLRPVRLIKQGLRSSDENTKIEKLDSITIRLRRAFISEFQEKGLNPRRNFKPNGEIAIVVNAFEYGKGRDFDFGPEGINNGRLVYYSPDVDKNQILNFNNMPIYGPIQYNGYPIGLDITVVELDSNKQQMKALLNTLAGFGAIAYPPAAPILPVLDALGTALLSGDVNDVAFRFTLVLDPDEGYKGLSYPTVEAGNYVFVRQQNRQASTDWNCLVLDDNTGLLHYNCGGLGANSPLYRENTYLTLQINSGFSSKDLDLSQYKFGTLLKQLEDADKTKADEITKILGSAKTAITQIESFSEAKSLLNSIKIAKDKNDKATLNQSLNDLIAMIRDEGKLTTEEINYLLKQLREIANPSDPKNISKFDSSYILDKKKTTTDIVNELSPLFFPGS